MIDAATPAIRLGSSAPGLLTTWTTEQIIDDVRARPSAARKTEPSESRSTRLGRFQQLYVRRLALSQRAPRRGGVVPAGGVGVRLQELTRWMYGRLKQFCQLLGERAVLEEAWQRAERSFPEEQILFSLTRAHDDHYLRYLADRPSQRIVQPLNKGAAPAIPTLTRIAGADPDAVVSILPCDHYCSSESAFSGALESTLAIAPIILRKALFWKGMP